MHEEHARPHGILLPDEFVAGLEPMFARLFGQQLAHVCGGDLSAPTVAQLIVARRRAALLWEFDRVTSNAAELRDQRGQPRDVRRAEHFAEREFVHRVTQLLVVDMDDADRMLDRAVRVEDEFERIIEPLRLVQEG